MLQLIKVRLFMLLLKDALLIVFAQMRMSFNKTKSKHGESFELSVFDYIGCRRYSDCSFRLPFGAIPHAVRAMAKPARAA